MTSTQSLHALLDQTNWIHALAQKLVADPHLAADLAQDTWVRALVEQPDDARPLRGWLATVMRNRLSKLRRGERNRAARERAQPAGELAPETLAVVEKAETHRNVVLAVLALEEPYRSTLLMRFFEQLSYDEIARRTGLTRAAVNSRVTRGLEQLRQRLESTYGGDRRALALALVPLAKLPTGVAATLFGVKVMHVAIGTAATALLTVGVSVGLSSSTRESAPAPLLAAALEPAGPSGVELAPEPQRERRVDSEQDLWRTEVFHSQVLAPTVERLAVNSSAGDVEVAESTSGRLEVQARVRARLEQVERSALGQAFTDHVELREEEGTLVIEDKHRNQRGWTVDLVVRVPGSLSLTANSGSGDVAVRHAGGKVLANTGSGDVRVELANERLTELSANSGSGDVVAEALSIEKKLAANTGSGEVTVRIGDPSSPGTASLSSGSGDLHLIVPPGISGSFELETYGGEVELPPAFGAVKRDVSGRKRAELTLGSGGGSYNLSSGSGSLRVELGHALPAKQD
jgi:RNA polymerase sigma-70 factor (ECF subfamily)